MTSGLLERIRCGIGGLAAGALGGALIGGGSFGILKEVNPESLNKLINSVSSIPYGYIFTGNLQYGVVTDMDIVFTGAKIGAALGAVGMALHGFVTRSPSFHEEDYPRKDTLYCTDCSHKNNCGSYSENGYHDSPCDLYTRPDEAI